MEVQVLEDSDRVRISPEELGALIDASQAQLARVNKLLEDR